MKKITRALISVYDKTGIVEIARELHSAGVEIVSTGATAAALRDAGVAVKDVSDVTGFPEVLDGRVKSLHPHIHAGILADQSNPEHVEAITDLDIAPFDLLVVNLYPFAQTVAAGASFAESIEQIDIGGPAMLRAAAKNHKDVTVLISPEDYAPVLEEMKGNQNVVSYKTNLALAKKVFAHTAQYDGAIANYLSALGLSLIHI
jgi:phosphoribosylaminoimidazolecarboxamide formyltransferase/IMP cyclohydrolase